MQVKYKKLIPVIILSFLNVLIRAQIVSSEADYKDTAVYITTDRTDPVFIFNNMGNDEMRGSLQAEPPADTAGWDFTWHLYNSETEMFDIPAGNSSDIDNLTDGGYRVTISHSNGFDTSFVAWVFINDLFLEIEKNSEGKIGFFKYTCDYLDLDARAIPDTFHYYDINSHEQLKLGNEISIIEWTWETEDELFVSLPGATSKLNIRTYSPPVENTTFTLEVSDSYGATKQDDVVYETISVRADFEIDYHYITEREDADYFKNYYKDAETTSAPQLVSFDRSSTSSKGIKFEWDFGNDSTLTSTDTIVEHKYYYPGTFDVVLTVYSAEGCVDSTDINAEHTVEINTEGPELAVPNYFVINGDNAVSASADQNYFRTYDVSVTKFEIVIFNRWGRKIHSFEGSDIREWPGWDGRINNSNDFVTSGVYFYVISMAMAFEDAETVTKFDKKIKRGFIQVFNPEN